MQGNKTRRTDSKALEYLKIKRKIEHRKNGYTSRKITRTDVMYRDYMTGVNIDDLADMYCMSVEDVLMSIELASLMDGKEYNN